MGRPGYRGKERMISVSLLKFAEKSGTILPFTGLFSVSSFTGSAASSVSLLSIAAVSDAAEADLPSAAAARTSGF